jgi:microcystin-dependent protein
MTFEKSLWSQDPSVGFAARVDRMLIAALWDEGVLGAAALKVSQRAAGANFSVDVAVGSIVITGDDQTNQGNYLAKCTALENITISAAPGSNSRYDIVVVRHRDSNAGGVGTSAGQTTATIADFNSGISVIAGTAAASPTVPAVPNTCALIAVIGPITSATSAITTALIHDATTGTGPTEAAGARRPAGRRTTPGEIVFQSAASPLTPSGWGLCAGQAVSRTTYADLFAAIGTTYGAGDGSTTFNLPDLRGRVPVGLDNMGGTDAGRLTASNTLGGSGGAETHTLSSAEIPAHTHPIDHDHAASNLRTTVAEVIVGGNAGDAGTLGGSALAQGTGTNLYVDLANFTGNSGNNTGGGGAHNNLQPYLLLNAIIRMS